MQESQQMGERCGKKGRQVPEGLLNSHENPGRFDVGRWYSPGSAGPDTGASQIADKIASKAKASNAATASFRTGLESFLFWESLLVP